MDRDNVRQWLPIVQRVSRETGVPVDVILALIDMESSGNPRAKSSAGALGLGQVMPFHFRKGEDPFDPYTNLSVGIGRVFKPALDRYGTLEQAAAAYFGAIDGKGNITGAKDATGTDGYAYVRKFSGLRKDYAGSGEAVGAEVSGAVFPVAGKSAVDIRYGYGDADYKRQTGNDHKGVDTYVPIGTQVVAPVSGRVVSAGYDGKNLGVVIEGPDGKHYSVWHLSKTQVKAGQQVQAGQPIALSGDTDANAPHVHFQIRAKGGGAHEDPSAFLASTGGGGKIGRARPMMATGGLGPPGTYEPATGEPRGPRDIPRGEQEDPGTGIDWLDAIIERRGSPVQVLSVGEPFIEETEESAEGGRDDTGAPITGTTKRTVRKPNPVNTQRLVWADGTYIDIAYETGRPARMVKSGTDKALASPEPEPGEPGAKEDTGPPPSRRLGNGTIQEWDEESRQWVDSWVPPPDEPKTTEPKPPPSRKLPDGTIQEWTQDGGWQDSYTPPAEQTDAQGNVINTDPDEPFIVTQNPDGSISQEINPNYQAQLEQQGYEVRQGEDGGWWAIDPGTGDAYPIDTGQAPVAPPNYTYREDPATGQIMAIDPATNTAIPVQGMGTPLPPEAQLIQNHLDTIAQIEGMLERGEITAQDADLYIEQSAQYTQAAQLGTTPFQQEQERRIARQNEQQMGESMLNQRLQSGSSLANGLISSAFNLASTTMMPEGMSSIGYDPAALAIRLVNEFGGGPEVTEFAKMLLMGSGATPEAQAAATSPVGTEGPLSVQASTSPVGATGASITPEQIAAINEAKKAAGGMIPFTGGGQTAATGGTITPEQFAAYNKRIGQIKGQAVGALPFVGGGQGAATTSKQITAEQYEAYWKQRQAKAA